MKKTNLSGWIWWSFIAFLGFQPANFVTPQDHTNTILFTIVLGLVLGLLVVIFQPFKTEDSRAVQGIKTFLFWYILSGSIALAMSSFLGFVLIFYSLYNSGKSVTKNPSHDPSEDAGSSEKLTDTDTA